VQIRGYVEHLLIRQGQRGHAFIGATETNDFADLVALNVMRHKWRAKQVGRASASGIGAVTESAGLLEEFVSALDRRIRRIRLLWPSREIP
jgi:hypothetical protein